jgi:hypothetical protein
MPDVRIVFYDVSFAKMLEYGSTSVRYQLNVPASADAKYPCDDVPLCDGGRTLDATLRLARQRATSGNNPVIIVKAFVLTGEYQTAPLGTICEVIRRGK